MIVIVEVWPFVRCCMVWVVLKGRVCLGPDSAVFVKFVLWSIKR